MSAQIRLEAVFDKGSVTADASSAGRAAGEAYAKAFSEATSFGTPILTAPGPGGNVGTPDFQRLAANVQTYGASIRSLAGEYAELNAQMAAFQRHAASMNPNSLGAMLAHAQNQVNAVRAGGGLPAAGGSPQQIQQAAQAHQQLGQAAQQAGNQQVQAMNQATAATNRYHSSLRSVLSTFLRISASAWVVERMGTSVLHGVEAPYRAVIDSTTDSRRFELAMGGGPSAHEANLSLMSRINQYPMSLADARQATIDMTRAGIAPSQAGQYLSTLANLQALNPQATSEAVTRALDEAALGNVRGLRNVVRIDPDQLAQLVGRDRATDFRGNPALLMQALSTYGRVFAPPGASDALNALPGTQLQHIRDEFSSAFSQVGDSGVFNVIVDRMRATADELATYFDPKNAQWVKHAKSISDSLGRVFTNATDAMAAGLAKLAGVDSISKTPEGIVGGIDEALQHFAKWSDTLPQAAANFGSSMNQLLSTLNRLADVADQIVRTKQQADAIGYGVSRGALPILGDLMDQSAFPIFGIGGAVRGRGFGGGTSSSSPYGTPIPGMGTPTTQPTGAANPLDPYRDIRVALIAAMTGQSALLSGYSLDREDRLGHLRADSDSAMRKILESGVLTPESRIGFQDVLDHTADSTAFSLADQALAQRDRINLAIARGGFGLAEAAKSNPFLASILYRQALSGTTANANAAATAEHFTGNRSGTFGFGALSTPEQLDALKAATEAQLRALKEGSVGAPTSDTLLSLLAGHQSTSSQQIQIYSQMLGYAEQAQAGARRASQANPNDPEAKATFQAATAQVQQYEAELAKAGAASNQFFSSLIAYGNQTQHTLESGLTGALTNVETHAKNTSQALREMARSLLNEFNGMLVHSIFGSVLGSGNGQVGVGNGLGGLIGAAITGIGRGGGAGASAEIATSAAESAFAMGGVADRPTLALFGEKSAEAFVPLQGGRIPLGVGPDGGVHAMLPSGGSIPTTMAAFADGGTVGAYSGIGAAAQAAGGGLVIHVNNFIDPVQLTQAGLHGGAGVTIENNMMKNLGPGGKLRKSLARNH